MQWILAAPFIHDASDRWLTAFVPEAPRRGFSVVPARYAHERSRRRTDAQGWRDYWRHGGQAWRAVRAAGGRAGVLTCFPQLAITVGARKRLSRASTPLVAWNFNVGTLQTGLRQRLARQALAAADCMVVHSRIEIEHYSRWLDLPVGQFAFVPLQRATRPIEHAEDVEQPFVLSMGSAQRDYRLLFEVLRKLRLPAIVVAGDHAVQGLDVPPNVQVRRGLTEAQCYELVQRARVSVIPIANQQTASGQVTLLDAMMYGRPVIITRSPACVDYVDDGRDALLVEPGNADDLASKLESLWHDTPRRAALGTAARAKAIERFSDEAVGQAMGDILARFES